MQPRVLILTDGKMGDLAQCRGVANAITSSDLITEEIVQPGWLTALPLPSMPLSAVDRQSSIFGTQWDIVIASGRRTVPYLRAFKRLGAKPPFTVFLKDPRFNHNDIDFIWTPAHDETNGTNVFSTITSPHTLTPEKLKVGSEGGKARYADFSSPNFGVILGGNSKSVQWTQEAATQFAKHLSQIPTTTSLVITGSRRTPALLSNAVKQALKDHRFDYWDGTGSNPYTEILAYCDRLIVTGDSHNMVSEALACGKPVHVFRPPGLQKKLQNFLDKLTQEGAIADLSKGFSGKTQPPIDATPEIAAEILTRFASSR